MNRLLKGLAGGLAALLLAPATALAQVPSPNVDELARALQPGQEVIVRGADGHKTKGEVIDVNGSALTVVVRDWWGGGERRLRFEQPAIATIHRTDSVWNGLLIGFAAGVLSAEVWRYKECGARGYDDECSAIVSAVGYLTMVPGGVAIGGLIDRFTNKLVYRAGGRAALHVRPVVSPSEAAVAVSLRF